MMRGMKLSRESMQSERSEATEALRNLSTEEKVEAEELLGKSEKNQSKPEKSSVTDIEE